MQINNNNNIYTPLSLTGKRSRNELNNLPYNYGEQDHLKRYHREQLINEIMLTLKSQLPEVNEKNLVSQIFSEIHNKNFSKRFSRKHDNTECSFIIKCNGAGELTITILDNKSFLGGGGYKTVKKGLEIILSESNTTLKNVEKVAIFKTISLDDDPETEKEAIIEKYNEIIESSKIFYKYISLNEITSSIRVIPPPNLETLNLNVYGKNISKSWFKQPLALGDMNSVALSPTEKFDVFLSLIPALKFIQSKGLSYMDWRLDNILVFKEGDKYVGKLADWDTLREYSESKEDTAQLDCYYGDNLYLEHRLVTRHLDVHSFWCMIFHSLLGCYDELQDLDDDPKAEVVFNLLTNPKTKSDVRDLHIYFEVLNLNEQVTKQDRNLFNKLSMDQNKVPGHILDHFLSKQEEYYQAMKTTSSLFLLNFEAIEKKLIELKNLRIGEIPDGPIDLELVKEFLD